MTTNSDLGLPIKRNAIRRNLLHDLRAPGFLGKWPLIGISMFLVGSLLFGAIAYEIQTNPALLQWDTATAQALHFRALNIPPPLMEYVVFGFFVGREMLVIFCIALALYFLHKRFWREFAMILLGPGLGGVLWYFMSRFFDRPRPTTQMQVILSDPSFPSGHAMSAVLFYGLLAYLLVPRISSRTWKWFVAGLSALVILYVGFSRLILGGHYVTDVIAGYAVGIAWAGLVYTLMERFFSEERTRRPESLSDMIPFEGFRSPGMFKRYPLVGFFLILVGVLSFGALGYEFLSRGPLVALDQSIYKALIVQAKTASPTVNDLMLFGFFLGKQVPILLVTILSIYFLYNRFWPELAMVLLSSAGGSFVWNFFVNYFARPRPAEQAGLEVRTVPSFPSGHAMSALIVYGFLAYLLIPKMPSRPWKWFVGIVTLLFILFCGFSRIFQGSHYLSDVLAGYALGIAWAALIYIMIENIFMRKKV
jgi:undecaprenyl-diphosphatase